MRKTAIILVGAALAVPTALGLAACSTSTDGHGTKVAAPPVAVQTTPAPAPQVPAADTYTDAQTTYLAFMHDNATDLEGTYTDAQLVSYGEQAIAVGAEDDALSAALRLADTTGIPPYDAGYITGAAAILLTGAGV